MTVSRMDLTDVYELAMKRLEIKMMDHDIEDMDMFISYDEITIMQFVVGYDEDNNICYDVLEAKVILSMTDELSDFISEVIDNEKTVKTYKQPRAFINALTASSKKDNQTRYTTFQG